MIQIRSEAHDIGFHKTILGAMGAARKDNTIWKISFNAKDGSRVRLMKYIYIAAYDKKENESAIRFEHQFILAIGTDEAYTLGSRSLKSKNNKYFLNDYVISLVDEF